MQAEDSPHGMTQSLAGAATVRLTKIHKMKIFYTPLEERFERLTRLGKRAMGSRVAAVSLVTEETQWFKSVLGWRIAELPIEQSMCLPMIQTGEALIVYDTLKDEKYAQAELVTAGPKFRFYAGYPLRDDDGKIIGTFSVMDVVPRAPDAELETILRDIGQLAERELVTADLWDAQSQLIAKLSEARRQALLDTLTRVWNRRGGMEILQSMAERSLRSYEQFGVCMVDVDNFKDINDTHGHQIGDQVLRQVASSIVSALRPDDIVCRYGGDEFMLVLRDASPEIARSVGERIKDALRRSPIMLRTGPVKVSLSIGAAVNDPSRKETAEELIENADQALYHTKQHGRDGLSVWPDDIR